MQGKVSSRKPKSSDAIAGDLKHLVGRKIKCLNGLTMYFVPESLATLPISPNLDLSFHNPLVRQMFLLHNALHEAYPPNCTVGTTPASSEWIIDSGCTNHMTGKRSLLMDSTLRPSDKSHITFADTGKSKVLGLGRVAISKDQHMDKVMLVESLGFNLMSVSMLCDLNMIVMFGKYRCLVLMESDKSLVFEGYRKDDLYVVDFSAGPQLAVCLLAKASECWL